MDHLKSTKKRTVPYAVGPAPSGRPPKKAKVEIAKLTKVQLAALSPAFCVADRYKCLRGYPHPHEIAELLGGADFATLRQVQ